MGKIKEMGFSEVSAKVRRLNFCVEFAPVDFLGCLTSNYTDEQLEKVVESIENDSTYTFVSSKNNIAE
jgi:hypothetical protein